MEVTLRSVLGIPGAYNLFRYLIGGIQLNNRFVDLYMRPFSGARILDIGCGTGAILTQLSNVDYVGFDTNHDYIAAATHKHGARGTFFCQSVTRATLGEFPAFDIVIAIGLMHHLNDTDAASLCELARSALTENGRFLTLDGCYVDGQSSVARYLLSKDRGEHVRTKTEYEKIVRNGFPVVETYIHHDLLRIPYTHIIMECSC